MLPAFSKIKVFPKLLSALLVAVSLFLMMPVYADTVPDARSAAQAQQDANAQAQAGAAAAAAQAATANAPQSSSSTVSQYSAADMIQNISLQIPSLMRLVTALAYVIGMVFVFMGIIKLKHVGEMRTQMSHEHSLKGPIIYLAVGAALIYFPSAVNVSMSTFWTSPNPYGYVVKQDQWTQFIATCLSIIQLFGVIAFIRGLVMLAQLGGHGGGHQGGLGKALTHMIGGIFCINIYQFVQVIMVTLGIQSPF